MGIQDLYDVFNEHCPHILQIVHLSVFAGYRLAIDISIFLYKFIRTSGPDHWLDSFIMLLCCLKSHGIQPVCVFDGPNPPKEKKAEQERRRASMEQIYTKIKMTKNILQRLQKDYIPTKKSPPVELVQEIKQLINTKRGKVDSINYRDVFDVVEGLESKITQWERQSLPITDIYKKKAKEIIQYMGFAQFQADGEAETLCATLCVQGEVDGVLSEDTDVLVYGTPMLLAKIDLRQQTVTVIQHKDILSSLNFTHDEFRDLCILLSCDYNDRVSGFPPDGKKRKKAVSIGVKGAFLMIQEYRKLEEVEKHCVDTDPLNYRRCRQLFTVSSQKTHIVPYSRPIEHKNLEQFLKTNKVRINSEYILNVWKPVPLIFHDDDEEELNEEIDHDVSESVIENENDNN